MANIWNCLVTAKPAQYEGPPCPALHVAKQSSATVHLSLRLSWDMQILLKDLLVFE